MGAAPMTGLEARSLAEDHAALKLWLRMLSCVTDIESEIRRRLREHFDITLPRFDYLAQVHRWPDGLKMGALSQHLMVSGGNVTTLTDDLERDGWVVRVASANDKRAWIVRLTPAGRRKFDVMAREHERWIVELFEPLDPATLKLLHQHLGVVRHRLLADETTPAA